MLMVYFKTFVSDSIFQDITWGTETVFQQQMCRAKILKASPSVLPVVLADVVSTVNIMSHTQKQWIVWNDAVFFF